MNYFISTLKVSPAVRIADLRRALSLFGVRGWTVAAVGGIATLTVVGIAGALVENPVFDRKLEARPQDYVIWGITAALGGLIIATFTLAPSSTGSGKTGLGGFLSVIAVGCPICNRLAVGLLGTSGALNIFGASQIYIGLASLVLLAWTLLLRAQAVVGACPLDDG